MVENERQKLKVDDAVIDDFISGRLQPAIESKLVSYFQSRPEVVKRLSEAGRRAVFDRIDTVQQRLQQQSQQAAHALRASLPPALAAYSGYQVERELGRGGMGVVYLAKNLAMDRWEVLKVLNERLLDHLGAKERFLREVRAVSKLNHPNIVTSYSVLPLDNLLVFVMEYVSGVDLQQYIRTHHPLPIDQCCALARQLAAGLQHAHLKGLVHRDIKPSNAIVYKLDNRLQLKILDFGLAKATSEEASNSLTQAGTVLGTPEYMSPEQTINPAGADIRADIYSLGCTLYHMLVGRPPFTGTYGSVLIQHAQDSAQPVNLLRPEVPLELVAVIEKMLAKQPDKRYQTPHQVNQALLPFIHTGNRSESSSHAAVTTAIDLAVAERETSAADVSLELAVLPEETRVRDRVSAPDLSRVSSNEDELRLQPIDGQRARVQIPPKPIETPSVSPPTEWRWIWGAPLVACTLLVLLLLMWQVSRWIPHLIQSGIGSAVVDLESPAATTEPVGREAADGREDLPPAIDEGTKGNSLNTTQADAAAVQAASAAPIAVPPELRNVDSPEAARLRRTMLNQARLQDNSENGRDLVRQLMAAPWPVDRIDRSTLSAAELFAAGQSDPKVAPKEMVAVLGNSRWKSADEIMALDSSYNGDVVVSGEFNGTVTVWDPGSGRMRSQFKSSDSNLYHLKLNRQGTRLLTSSVDGVIRMWDVSPPSLVRSFVGHEAKVISAVFSAEENRIYSVDAKKLIIWDAFTAARKQTVPLPEAPHESAAHPSEERVVIGCKAGKVVIVDTAEAKIIEEIELGKVDISSVDYSPDGKLVAASLYNGNVHVWRADKRYQQLRKKTAPGTPLNSIHFSRDSRVLAVGARGSCWFWDQNRDEMELHHDTHSPVADVIPVGDRWLVGWSETHWMAMVDSQARLQNSDSAPITGASLSPDGGAIAVTLRDAEQVHVWKLDNRPMERTLPGQTQWDNAISYSVDGQRIYTAGGNWQVKVWEITEGIQSSPFKTHENWILGLDVAADGKQLCTSAYDRTARIWDIQTGAQLHRLGDHGSTVLRCRYSPDGSQLATACWDGIVRIWNARSGALITALPKANRGCDSAAFQPFSQCVAATANQNVVLYSISDGAVVRTFSGHDGPVLDVDFTLDGSRMVTSSADGTVRLWDSATGEQIKSIRLHPRRGWISQARFTYDGRHVYVSTGNGTVTILRV